MKNRSDTEVLVMSSTESKREVLIPISTSKKNWNKLQSLHQLVSRTLFKLEGRDREAVRESGAGLESDLLRGGVIDVNLDNREPQ